MSGPVNNRLACLREMEVSAMHLQNYLGGDRPPSTWSEEEAEYAWNWTTAEFERLSAKYSEADMRWAATAIKDDARYEPTPTPTTADYRVRVHHVEHTMGYWQSVGARIITSFVVVGVLALISVACQASGR